MAMDASPHRRGSGLTGRRAECGVLDRLIEAVRAGESQVLVVHGEPGVGKTALLEYAIESAAGLRVARVAGVESEMELAFAALQQLCAPMLGQLGGLPDPQRAALGVAFGLNTGAAPDRFLVGLATLSLLSEAAGRQPLLCVVDDAQWLDRASALVLTFVARRLLADPVALVFATHEPGEGFRGLPELPVRGLGEGDARELLGSVLGGLLDERVRDRIVAETRGNPLALLELPRGVLGVPGLSEQPGLPGRIEESFRRRVEVLPAATRRLMLVAAAELAGDPALVRRAAERLGIGAEAVAPAADAGLLTTGSGWCSGIRWCGRRCTGPRRWPNGGPRTRRWLTRPIRGPTPIAGPGTARRPRRDLMRTLLRSWRARRAGPRRAAGWPRRPRSWSGRPC